MTTALVLGSLIAYLAMGFLTVLVLVKFDFMGMRGPLTDDADDWEPFFNFLVLAFWPLGIFPLLISLVTFLPVRMGRYVVAQEKKRKRIAS